MDTNNSEETIVAKRSTGLMAGILSLSWLIVSLLALVFSLPIMFGETAEDTAIAIFFAFPLAGALVWAIRETYFMMTIPCVLAKISDGVLHICPKKKKAIPIDSFHMYETRYSYYGAIGALAAVILVAFTVGIILFIWKAPFRSQSGKISLKLKTGETVKLRYVKDINCLLRQFGFHV